MMAIDALYALRETVGTQGGGAPQCAFVVKISGGFMRWVNETLGRTTVDEMSFLIRHIDHMIRFFELMPHFCEGAGASDLVGWLGNMAPLCCPKCGTQLQGTTLQRELDEAAPDVDLETIEVQPQTASFEYRPSDVW